MKECLLALMQMGDTIKMVSPQMDIDYRGSNRVHSSEGR
jgi:hypothetical protein